MSRKIFRTDNVVSEKNSKKIEALLEELYQNASINEEVGKLIYFVLVEMAKYVEDDYNSELWNYFNEQFKHFGYSGIDALADNNNTAAQRIVDSMARDIFGKQLI